MSVYNPFDDPPVPVRWYASKRFWSLVGAVGGGLGTATATVMAGIALMATSPVVGIACIAGAVVALAGTAGMAYFGANAAKAAAKDYFSDKAGRTVQFKQPDGPGDGQPPLAPQP